jgi:hypothetical protein
MIQDPQTWIGYLPANIPLDLNRGLALKLNGIFDIVLGALLIMRWWPKIVASLAVLHLVGILVTQGIDTVLIRDVGLLGASLSLLTWPRRHSRSHDAR